MQNDAEEKVEKPEDEQILRRREINEIASESNRQHDSFILKAAKEEL
jgi:hypothetical protein